MTAGKGINTINRLRLDKLHRELGKPFSVHEAGVVLGLGPKSTRRLLAQFATRGWLSRIRRNAYALVPLGASKPADWREDPLSVAATIFAPSYLGGWTAAEHWSLTEQIFRDVIVFTSRRLHERSVTLQGTTFRLAFVGQEKFFGLQTIWRGQTRISISDPSRTIADLLDNPTLGGGIRHVAEILTTYFESQSRDDAKLLEYIPRLGNRAAWKRLGFLLETLRIEASSLNAMAVSSISTGLSPLDPGGPKAGRINKRWNLRVNVAFVGSAP